MSDRIGKAAVVLAFYAMAGAAFSSGAVAQAVLADTRAGEHVGSEIGGEGSLKVASSAVHGAPRVYATPMHNLADRCPHCMVVSVAEGNIDLLGVRDAVIRSLLEHKIEISFSGVAVEAGELLIISAPVGKAQGYYQVRVIADGYDAATRRFSNSLNVGAALLRQEGEAVVFGQDATTREIEKLIGTFVTLIPLQ
jgi:hypothetical protein